VFGESLPEHPIIRKRRFVCLPAREIPTVWKLPNRGCCTFRNEAERPDRRPLKRWIFPFCSPMIGGMTGLGLGLPMAWLVRCKKCACTINCRAIDPQIEHSQPEKADPPPRDTVIVTCSCCWAAYRYSPAEVFKGPPGPSSNCSRHTPAYANNNNQG
jgi:hypothetical protein